MKKALKAKAPRQRRKRQPNPIVAALRSLDEDTLAMFRQLLQNELGAETQTSAPEDPVELFARYLVVSGEKDADDEAKADLARELTTELGDLRISSNGGDREARENIRAILDLLDDALEARSLAAVDLMMIGKIFTDADWVVPDSLKQAVIEAMTANPPESQGGAGADIASALLELADEADQSPFEVHAYMNSLMAGFPSQASAGLLFELAATNKAVIVQAVAGFVLHPEADLARAAAEALAIYGKQAPVESSLIERLVRMRPWLPPPRQAQLDATIRVLRSNALPPVKPEPAKLIKCHFSICDGSGTRTILATQRIGTRYQIATVMVKVSGVADAMMFSSLSKSEMDDIVRQLKSSLPVMEGDLPGFMRSLELGIAENVASGLLPPFKLVEVLENLGLGPIHPKPASPLEIIEGLLADLPPEQTDRAAVARAHAAILNSEFRDQWFEAGEALEEMLYPIRGFKQRVAKLMTAYLPERRQFWARQCAICALVMRKDEKQRLFSWKPMALIGRDLASDVPLDRIPLMKRVAEISVRAFESRG